MAIPTLSAEIQFTSGIWTDVTPWLLQSVDVKRGSSRVESPVIRYEPGHATIMLDNRDRRFDPTNLQGPYVVNGVSKVTAMRPCRLLATWKGTKYPLFRGFIDEWQVDWIANVHSTVTVSITDGFKVLSNKRRAPTTQVVNGQIVTLTYGDGEDTGARVTRILDSAGWPVADRSIAVGDSLLQATPLSGDALSELQIAAESEIGELYINASGQVVFRNRSAIFLDTRSTRVQLELGTFVDTPAPFSTKLSTDDATLWNEVRVTVIGGTEQLEVDSASVTENQPKTYEKSGLYLQDDITASNFAEWILYISKDPEVRFDSLAMQPIADADYLFPHVLTREIGDRVRIVYRPPGGGLDIIREVFIRGISHSIGQESWVTSWIFQSATRYISNFFILGSSTNGVLDQNILSF